MFATNLRIKENQAQMQGLLAGNDTYKFMEEKYTDFRSKYQGADAVKHLPEVQQAIQDHINDTRQDLSPIAAQH